jgi:hypothetical protein
MATTSLTTNPIVIGAVMASDYKSQVLASLGSLFTLRIEKIFWENAVTKGDYARIIDPGSGNEIATIYNVSANSSYVIDYTPNPRIWQNFRVDQLDSGTLRIYTRGG